MANQNIEKSIYNGKHFVQFKNSSHRYKVDGKAQQGVTTIMNQVLAKPDLMLWPLNMALKHLQSKIPHVTLEDLEEARSAHIKKRDAGGNTGTTVHELAERILLGSSPSLQGYDEEVQRATGGLIAWLDVHAPKVVAVEQVVYSAAWRYAGTFDFILEIDGKNYLCDLKTTNPSKDAPQGIYAEYFIQLGAYYMAYEEQRQYELAHGGTELVEIHDLLVLSCKKDGAVDARTASEFELTLEECSKLWECTLVLHRSLHGLKSRLRAKVMGTQA